MIDFIVTIFKSRELSARFKRNHYKFLQSLKGQIHLQRHKYILFHNRAVMPDTAFSLVMFMQSIIAIILYSSPKYSTAVVKPVPSKRGQPASPCQKVKKRCRIVHLELRYR